MATSLERIAYRSRAELSMDSLLAISDILAVSQRNNARDGITGALIYSDGVFFQVVEGAAQDLDRLLRRLSGDPRHAALDIVSRERASDRMFGDWSMTAPRINPARADEMRQVVAASDAAPTEAIAAVRKLAEEAGVRPF